MELTGLNGAAAIVTGAAQGNGAAIARGLAASGARVALGDVLDASPIAREIATAGGVAEARALDVTDPESVDGFCAWAANTFGPVKILINNAGVIRRADMDAQDYVAGFDAVHSVNVAGPRNMTRACLSQLKETRGVIVNLASIMSLTAGPGMTAYASSKGAVAQFTKALAHELAPFGVRANAIMPGVIATPMTKVTRDDPDAIGRFLAHTPMGRVGEPEELVGPTQFLASDQASYVTGALLAVDGGYLAG